MKYWTEYTGHTKKLEGKRKDKIFDNNIYTFDIETSSYIKLNGKILPAIEYDNMSDNDKDNCQKMCCMYIWQFSINEQVYYGRTWDEFLMFLNKLNECVPEKKYVFVHNLSFEFTFIDRIIKMTKVMARKSHKVMTCFFEDYNIEFRCSYFMSNVALKYLPDMYKLPVEKMVGDLDYNLIRTPATKLTEKELGYCKNDCLVVYEYIKFELNEYETVKNIPITSTGHVRRELKNKILKDFEYKRRVRKAVDTDPIVFNRLYQAFAGGFTHSSWVYTDMVLKNVDSYDFTSSYPYVMVTHKFPSTSFIKCNIKNLDNMISNLAYLIHIKFYNIKSKYYNNFISASKCITASGIAYDNGRIMKADYIETVITDVDARIIMQSYDYDSYEILDAYSSVYNYLPKTFINFVLDKYVEKTKYKNVEGKEQQYAKSKASFNALFGMSVTNTIRDNVEYDQIKGWSEIPLTNDEIIAELEKQKSNPFMSYAWGVWITAFGRNNLLKNIMLHDDYVVYCDTDSIKLVQGYDKSLIDEYNKFVENKIKFVSEQLDIPLERFAPKDVKGVPHMLGLFECETDKGRKYTYDKFITQGAKKYCVEIDGKIKITVAGVPKCGCKALKDINEFRDDFIFRYKDTGKLLIQYVENQEPHHVIDYQGNDYYITDVSGCCLLPTTYVLGKSADYTELLTDNSSNHAIFKEE